MCIHDVMSAAISGHCAYKVAIMSLKVNGEKGFSWIIGLFGVFPVILHAAVVFNIESL